MGCLKLTYRSEFLHVWKGTVHEKSGYRNFLAQGEKNAGPEKNDNYYPFGLKFNSYSRENSVPNTIKLFQGQEHIDDLGLNWDSFKWRNHQPDIGRFFNIDPLADKYVYNSPYAFSENQVVAHRELEGLEKEPVNKEPGIVEQVAVAYFMLLDKIGGTVNERNGNDNPSFNQNVVAATNLISDVVLSTQAHGEIMNSSGNSSNGTKAATTVEKTAVTSEVKAVSTEVKTMTHSPSFIVDVKGTAYPVPKGATGPTPVVNPAGKVTGSAFTGGTGGTNGQVSTMRIMNSTPARGSAPSYPGGYIKYENAQGQGVNPTSGRTGSNANTHIPLPILNDH